MWSIVLFYGQILHLRRQQYVPSDVRFFLLVSFLKKMCVCIPPAFTAKQKPINSACTLLPVQKAKYLQMHMQERLYICICIWQSFKFIFLVFKPQRYFNGSNSQLYIYNVYIYMHISIEQTLLTIIFCSTINYKNINHMQIIKNCSLNID